MYIIGVDGGGTKTKAILFHTKLGLVWSIEDFASNPHSTGYTNSVNTIIRIIEKAYSENRLSGDIEMYVSLGIAGLGRELEQKKWLSLFRESSCHLPTLQEITIENDGKIALYSSTLGKDGIVSICGTGALTYGMNNQNTARVGGWGHLIGGDPGSGYYIGFQALEAIFNEKDGLGDKTRITYYILDKEKVDTVQDLVSVIYKDGRDEKQRIASLTPYVFAAAKEGDVVANQIMRTTANQIASRGRHLYQILFSPSTKKVPFALVGGVFQNTQMIKYVEEKLKGTTKLSTILVDREPVIGSIVVVLQRKGFTVEQIKTLVDK